MEISLFNCNNIISGSLSITENALNVKYAMLLVGLLFLAIMIVVLDYMRTRIGLKPKEYTKDDLEFKISKEK